MTTAEQRNTVQYIRKLVHTHPDPVTSLIILSGMAEFNFYRITYDKFSFADKKRLNLRWYNMYPEQNYTDQKFVAECFQEIVGKHGHFLRVHELGGYTGELAWKILHKHPRITWTSYEIIKHKIKPELADNFSEYVLDKQIWKSGIGLDGDVFVSTHTLEHFVNAEFLELLDWLFKQNLRYLVLQMPLHPKGQTWNNYYGSHLLLYGSLKVKELLGVRYQLLGEVVKGEKEHEGWCSFWRLKDG